MLSSPARRRRPLLLTLLAAAAFTVATPSRFAGFAQSGEDEKPKLALRATPRVGFVPAEILFVGELRGGADDYEEFYCATVEWDWDDDTRSESTPDCDPYEPGASRIRRRYSTRHRFDYPGRYEVRLNLKRRGDTVASARAVVELRGGRFGRFD